eukprot:tig00021181_g19307.t1
MSTSELEGALAVLEVTNSAGDLLRPELLRVAERVHRQLRPHLGTGDAYVRALERVFAGGGRMIVAVAGADDVVGVCVYRIYADTASGMKFYVDDLIVDEKRRSRGAGHAIIQFCEAAARRAGSSMISRPPNHKLSMSTSELEGALAVLEVTNSAGDLLRPELLRVAERVHRQLRPHLGTGDAYVRALERVFAGGGRMIVAVAGADDVVGVCVYRIYADTASGMKFYVDDLIVDEKRRSRGAGHAIIQFCEAAARRAGSSMVCLDSGTQRHGAHQFYHREKFFILAYHFRKNLL